MIASSGTYVEVLETEPGYGGYYGVCGTSEAWPWAPGVVSIADQAARGWTSGSSTRGLYALARLARDVRRGIFDARRRATTPRPSAGFNGLRRWHWLGPRHRAGHPGERLGVRARPGRSLTDRAHRRARATARAPPSSGSARQQQRAFATPAPGLGRSGPALEEAGDLSPIHPMVSR